MRSSLSGSNNRNIKTKNSTLVLKIISTMGPVSRIRLSKITGLTKMAITKIVSELISIGIVVETNQEMIQTSGRKPVLLGINPTYAYAAGVFISRKACIFSLCDAGGNMVYSSQTPLDHTDTAETLTEKVVDGVRDALGYAGEIPILGIGVACIGPLDNRNGIILNPPNFYGIRDVSIKSALMSAFSLPIYVDNVTKASALAEKYFGGGINISNFAYVSITHGIGAGLVTNGKLYNGEMGFSGEIGHTTVDIHGEKCDCGNTGCLELYADIPHILTKAEECLAAQGAPIPDLGITWNAFVDLSRKGDACATAVLEDVGRYIATGLVTLCNCFDPRIIFIGHEFALLGDEVFERLEALVNARMLASGYTAVQITRSTFIDSAPNIGSCTLVLDQLFNDTPGCLLARKKAIL